MKKIIILCLMMVSTFSCLAQQIDYNKIILPSHIKEPEFSEKLVQLAWKNHPSNRIVEQEVQIQREQKKQTTAEWISGIGITGNLNEFTLNSQADEFNRSAFYPKYNVYGRIDLGTIFLSPSKKREANFRIRVAEENVNMRKLEVRRVVLSAYQDYVKFQELFIIQSEIAQNSFSELQLAEQNFMAGSLTVKEYENAQQDYAEQRKQKVVSENNYLKAKYDLEYLIGVSLDEVI